MIFIFIKNKNKLTHKFFSEKRAILWESNKLAILSITTHPQALFLIQTSQFAFKKTICDTRSGSSLVRLSETVSPAEEKALSDFADDA